MLIVVITIVNSGPHYILYICLFTSIDFQLFTIYFFMIVFSINIRNIRVYNCVAC